jgi:hypothetical protein
MTQQKASRITRATLAKATCGQIGGNGARYPRHSGNGRLSLENDANGNPIAICQGCGQAFSADQVRELAAAPVG